ncbi:MAG: PhzF family phenazine biosynthesis protein [Planctomycetota bacterium]|nr:PhzF family phenazine biosynthesis protein [Planctomycetota bacterium]
MTTESMFRFDQIDVFSKTPLLGNALAVVHAADSLSTSQMEHFARWTQLSETTFLLAPETPEADYKVRIFTPEGELPFAGHPTLGSAHAWLNAGGSPADPQRIIQECGVGLIPIRKGAEMLAFRAPDLLKTGPVDEETLQVICHGLGIERSEILLHQWVDNGPGWAAVTLDSAERVLSINPNFSLLTSVNFGIIGPHDSLQDADYEVRAFVNSLDIPEDPVTGSLAAGIAQWFSREGLAEKSYTIAQGQKLQRQGRIHISEENGEIWVGGVSTRCISGTLHL